MHKFVLNFICLTSQMQVLYGLEYAHSIKHIREALEEASRLSQSKSKSEIYFADVKCSVMNPSDDHNNSNGLVGPGWSDQLVTVLIIALVGQHQLIAIVLED